MENTEKEFQKDGKCLPQYGKKGHKPRKPIVRGAQNLDEIHTNDIRYWNNSPGFTNVSKFNWNTILGREISPDVIATAPSGYTWVAARKFNPPMVMTLKYIYGPGWASDVNDGVNRALAQVMANIRASLSTANIGFETADLGIFVSSTSSIAVNIGYAKRALESYKVWKSRNYGYPRALIQAMGFEYEDIMKNINTYSARLNALIDMYNNMSVPDIFQIYDRQYSMAHSIFCDEDSELGQLYLFKPSMYYVYDDTTSSAKVQNIDYELMTSFDDFLTIIQSQINSWYTSSDLYLINGVLLRAFKDAPRQEIPYYNSEDLIEPVVDRAFLMQIMNCSIIQTTAVDITQDPSHQNFVIWKPTPVGSGAGSVVGSDNVILRLFENDITEDDNMEMTRLLNFTTTDGSNTTLRDCGSEIVTGVTVYSYNAMTNQVNQQANYISNILSADTTNSSAIQNLYNSVMAIQPFRYIPTILAFVTNSGNKIAQYVGLVGDVYNWTVYNVTDWHKLQQVAYQSIWKPINISLK